MMPIARCAIRRSANTMLVGLAVECRDLAMIAGRTVLEREVRGLEHLDADLLDAFEQLVRAVAATASDGDALEQ